jgi:hypothetical protein
LDWRRGATPLFGGERSVGLLGWRVIGGSRRQQSAEVARHLPRSDAIVL